MASVKKSKSGWRAQVYKRGKRASKLFPTKNQATMWAIEMETVFSNDDHTVAGYTIGDACERYAVDISPTKKGERSEVVRLRALQRDMLAKIPIERAARRDIQDWIDRQETKPGTTLRKLSLLQSVFKAARRWRWTNENPFPDLEKPKTPPGRDRLITDEEIDAIVNHVPERKMTFRRRQAIDAFQIAIETGMRAGEILGLRWEYVFLDDRYCHLPDTKNGTARDVPLSSKAVAVFESRDPKESGRIFTLTSNTLHGIFTSIKKDCKLSGFTFHDTRHRACTDLAEKLSMMELARVIGHRDPRSLVTYYNPTAKTLAAKLD